MREEARKNLLQSTVDTFFSYEAVSVPLRVDPTVSYRKVKLLQL